MVDRPPSAGARRDTLADRCLRLWDVAGSGAARCRPSACAQIEGRRWVASGHRRALGGRRRHLPRAPQAQRARQTGRTGRTWRMGRTSCAVSAGRPLKADAKLATYVTGCLAAAGRRAVDAGDRREPRGRAVDAERLSQARRARRSRLAAARGADRRGARGDAVPAAWAARPGGCRPSPTGRRSIASSAQGRDAGAAVGGVPRRRIPTATATAGSASSTGAGRAGWRRRCASTTSPASGCSSTTPARRIEVIDAATGEVRQAQLFVAVLGASNYTFAEATWTQSLPDWIGSHARALRLLRRRAGADRVRQPQVRRHQGLLLRAGGQPHLRRHGGALRHRRRAGAALQAARQGQGRGRRPGGAALDRGAAAQPAVLLARRAERGDPRAGRRAQRPRDAAPRRQPPAAVRGPGAAGAEAAAGGALRLRAVEGVPGRARLPRRGRAALLLGAAPAAAPEGLGAHHRAHGRALPRGQRVAAHLRTSSEPPPHDGARAHAVEPPALRRLDAGAHPAAGRRDRPPAPRRWSRSSCASAPIPSRASAPASASCGWPRPMAPSGSRPPAAARSRSAPAPTPRSTRS